MSRRRILRTAAVTAALAMACLLMAPQREKPATAPSEPAGDAGPRTAEPAGDELASPAFVTWAHGHGWRADEIVPGQIAVAFEPGVSRAEREESAARIGGRLGRDRAHRDGTASSTVLLPPTMGIRRAILACRAQRGVATAEPVVRMQRLTSDPLYPDLWSLHNTGQDINGVAGTPDADIDAPEAWGIQTGSSSVVIAIIDSGVDFNHPDLSPNTWTNPGEMGGGKDTNGADDDSNTYIDDWRGWDFDNDTNDPTELPGDPDFGHGTGVASVAAGVADNGVAGVGIAYGCTVMHLRAGDTTAVANAVRYAVDMGAKVINISQGHGSYIATERNAIDYARTQGVLVCCAAGNDANDNDATPLYPASYALDNILSVAASNKDDGIWYDGVGSGSNTGATSVDLAAPGAEISSAEPGRTVLFESDLTPQTLFADDFDDDNFGSDWTLGQDPGGVENSWGNVGGQAQPWGFPGSYPA
ncbi:S8 family serine peptidase, partial [bacterium]|nr:S8 family serine peptidase [bacterium]